MRGGLFVVPRRDRLPDSRVAAVRGSGQRRRTDSLSAAVRVSPRREISSVLTAVWHSHDIRVQPRERDVSHERTGRVVDRQISQPAGREAPPFTGGRLSRRSRGRRTMSCLFHRSGGASQSQLSCRAVSRRSVSSSRLRASGGIFRIVDGRYRTEIPSTPRRGQLPRARRTTSSTLDW